MAMPTLMWDFASASPAASIDASRASAVPKVKVLTVRIRSHPRRSRLTAGRSTTTPIGELFPREGSRCVRVDLRLSLNAALLVSGNGMAEHAAADDAGRRCRPLACPFAELVSSQAAGAGADERAATAQKDSDHTHDRDKTHRPAPTWLTLAENGSPNAAIPRGALRALAGGRQRPRDEVPGDRESPHCAGKGAARPPRYTSLVMAVLVTQLSRSVFVDRAHGVDSTPPRTSASIPGHEV